MNTHPDARTRRRMKSWTSAWPRKGRADEDSVSAETGRQLNRAEHWTFVSMLVVQSLWRRVGTGNRPKLRSLVEVVVR